MKMKRQSFLIGAILLAFGGVFAKVIGAFYKIPLTNILGTNGMGIYYLIFPFYSLVLVLVSSGVSLAVTRFVSLEKQNHNIHNQKLIFKTSILYVSVLSLIFMALFMALHKIIAFYQGNINAKFGYIAIAPAIIFASIIAIVRGYFQGQQNMFPTLINNIIEQIVKLISGLILSNYFIHKGVIYAVLGAVLGVTISEFVSLIAIVIHFFIYKKKLIYKIEKPKSDNWTFYETLKKILKYSYPATLTALIMPITGFLDSFMIINLLVKTGFSSLQSTNLYGISNGIVNTLIGLPVVVCSAISTAIIPNLSGIYIHNDIKEIEFKTSFFIKVSWIIALPCFVMFMIFAPDIISMLYKRGLSNYVIDEFQFSYKLLMLSSVTIIYYAFMQTFTSILQSINKPLIPFLSLVFALVIRIILLYSLVAKVNINIFGVAIANVGFLASAIIVNLIFIKKYIKIKLNFYTFFIIPIFAIVVSGVIIYFIRISLCDMLNVWLYSIICGLIFIVLYCSLILIFKCFNKKEISIFLRNKRIKV